MKKLLLAMILSWFSLFNCVYSYASSSPDLLDDYGCDTQVSFSKTHDSIYSIPTFPNQDRMYNPGQPYGEVIQQAGSYVFPSLCDVVKSFTEHQDEGVRKMVEIVGKNIATSVTTLTDYKAMQGDTSLSVCQLIQEGKIRAAKQYLEIVRKQEAHISEEKKPMKTYEQRAYNELQNLLQELQKHDDEIQKELWTVLERKMKKNKELLKNIFLLLEALENGTLTTLEGDGTEFDLFEETEKVFLTMYRSNALFMSRASHEAASFEQFLVKSQEKIQVIEHNLNQYRGSLAAVAQAFEKAVSKK